MATKSKEERLLDHCVGWLKLNRIDRDSTIKDVDPYNLREFVAGAADIVGYFDRDAEHKQLMTVVDVVLSANNITDDQKVVIKKLQEQYSEFRYMYEDLC